ncbi:MAG: bifunctional oligoribonuclease/PAP phosphatase NrnA [Candidatus Enteromonas sp.]|nr:bifunctional oligoribonuclease/PAP phosphatase NrnA [Candidatus Enteromonas sp.]
MKANSIHPLIAEVGKTNKKLFKTIYKAIERYQKIVVFRHIKPDFDALGCQMGLATFLKENFPEKEIHFVGDSHPTFVPRLFPEPESLPNEWFQGRDFLAIVCDVGEPKRIADPRFAHARYKIKIDHHPAGCEIAKRATYLNLESASASELVADLLLNYKGKTLSAKAARYLYIGIVGDSGRFLYSSTSPHTFAVAESLISTGFPLHETYLSMYQKSIDSLTSLGYVLSHFHVSPHGVAYYLLPSSVQEELHITPIMGKEHVNAFSNIEGINAWCSITEDPQPKDYCWRISIRSKHADISQIAQKWGGGGHAQASGARIDSLDDLDAFIADLDNLFI